MADQDTTRADQDTKSDEHREDEAPHPAQSEHEQSADEDAPPSPGEEPAQAHEQVEQEEGAREEPETDEHAAPAEASASASAPVPEPAEDGAQEEQPQSPQTEQPPPPRISLPEASSEHSEHGEQQDRPPTDSSEHTLPPSPSARLRTDSQSTAATTATAKTTTRSSLVFVVTALETIAASKDARKTKKLADTTQKALSAIKGDGDPSSIDPEVLFEPLQLATEANTVQVVTVALDCIGKLISYSYFSYPSEHAAGSPEQPALIDRAIDTICDCFQMDATHADIELQILKSLLSAILNDKIVVHGAGLLKAVRQTYNIFLHSKSSNNQQVAQGALTQMVGTVFERVKSRLRVKEARINLSKSSLHKNNSGDVSPEGGDIGGVDSNGDGDQEGDISENASDMPVEKDEGAKITLQSFENRKSFDDAKIADNAPTLVTRNKARRTPSRTNTFHSNDGQEGTDPTEEEEEDEIYVKDAYLVFRAMCRLSTKTVPLEEAQNVRSQSMRSKLLALHIIHTILHNNVAVFVSPYATIRSSNTAEPTTFVQAIKQYLCLSLSRNGASSLKQVFEISCEIFWLMLHQLRVMLKKEIEVFMKEIYLAVLEKRSAPVFQKQYILQILHRLGGDPRALVEIYLNYDCDRSALDNHFQKIVEHLARVCSTPVAITPQQQQAFQEHHAKHQASSSPDWQTRATLPPSLATMSIQPGNEVDLGFPPEYSLKQESLGALVEILRSLVNWSQQSISDAAANLRENDVRPSNEDFRDSIDTRANITASPAIDSPNGPGTPVPEDDPSQLERAKQRKTALNHAIRQFNYKPKKGMKLLLKDGFIPSDSPEDIARFFLSHDTVDKKALGEYLGEGDDENIKIMHSFVDQMDFTRTRFVDALRRFLQSFRLPGEAQKIDRFMLKFAERYMTGNPTAFANADTAYVLSYSVIMLNTDQHSSKMKGRRMTPEDFIKNNRGINDNADLPDDYLKGIYEEIANNEIVLDTEREVAANLGQIQQPNQGGGLGNIGQAFANVGRDLQREAYIQASEQMANRTEQLYKSLLRAQRRGPTRFPISKFIPASSFKHVGPMFEVTWMPFLTALSGPAQNTHNLETIKLCMEGQKLAIRIACLFDLEDPRQAFVTSLSRFTNLYNLTEMKAKNIEALYALLDVAQHEGNLLKESWREILTCISQLDRFQLISAGIEDTAVPDLMRSNSAASTKSSTPSRKSLNAPNKSRPRSGTSVLYHSEAAVESRSADMIRAVDRIFTNTANLSGEAIVQFVRALTQVSWQEIQSSGQSESPRTYSLQKLVEISSYNMNRVRFEWTNIWQILGEHFNQVGCHTNTNVVFFALNSLRQLSMKFLEIGELPGFKFQKDFLKPFEHIMKNTGVVPVKDMVLRCLIQMIQARGENIRSGWRSMFGVFTVAAKEPYEGIVNLAFDNITQVYNTRFGVVISQGAFADLVVCLTEFSKNHKFQRKSLQAIETLKSTVPKMLRTPECPLSIDSDKPKDEPQATGVPKQPTRQTQEEQFWFPVLFAYHDVLMTGEDLEVRSRALTYLFDTLQQYGAAFPRDFWDILWRQILYPIFMVLRSKSEMSNALNHEELTVWLSTTFIQALRHMIALFTHFFGALEYMLDRFLELLALCICQENDTLARIGSNCLQQLVHQNVTKFSEEHWERIVSAFVDLFQRTEATALFSAATAGSYTPAMNGKAARAMSDTTSMSDLPLDLDDKSDIEDPNALGINGLMSPRRGSAAVSDDGTPNGSPRTDLEDYKPVEGIQQAPVVVTAARRRFFNQIITKCVLQLLMIETVNELFSNDDVYAQIPSPQLLRLMMLLKKSYQFAKRFNEDRELRTKLFREGFMKQPPNLLKQESGSAAVYVSILFRMYHDTSSERRLNRANTEQALIPLCVDIVTSYIQLDEETQQRNIVTWRPVVIDVLDGYAGFPEVDFDKHVKVFAPLVVGLMNRDMGLELQRSVQNLLQRVLEVKVGIAAGSLVVDRGSPMGERRPSVLGRRGSKAGPPGR